MPGKLATARRHIHPVAAAWQCSHCSRWSNAFAHHTEVHLFFHINCAVAGLGLAWRTGIPPGPRDCPSQACVRPQIVW